MANEDWLASLRAASYDTNFPRQYRVSSPLLPLPSPPRCRPRARTPGSVCMQHTREPGFAGRVFNPLSLSPLDAPLPCRCAFLPFRAGSRRCGRSRPGEPRPAPRCDSASRTRAPHRLRRQPGTARTTPGAWSCPGRAARAEKGRNPGIGISISRWGAAPAQGMRSQTQRRVQNCRCSPRTAWFQSGNTNNAWSLLQRSSSWLFCYYQATAHCSLRQGSICVSVQMWHKDSGIQNWPIRRYEMQL